MKTIIAGSRDITDIKVVEEVMQDLDWEVTENVCGLARGVDMLGAQWAYSKKIRTVAFPADWDKYGRRAGHVRNREMAEYAEALVAIWDGESAGTRNMISEARRLDLKVKVVIIGK